MTQTFGPAVLDEEKIIKSYILIRKLFSKHMFLL